MAALGHVFQLGLHVVAQIVKAQFVVGGIGDVAGIGLTLFVFGLMRIDDAGGHAQSAIDFAHPFRVTFRQIVVHGHDMHALAGQRVQIGWEGRHKGFALAGLHLGNVALVQEDPAHQLRVKGAQTQRTLGGFATVSEGLGQDCVQLFAVRHTLLQFFGLGDDAVIRQGGEFVLKRVDLFDNGSRGFDLAIIRCAKDFTRDFSKHVFCASMRFNAGLTRGNLPVPIQPPI